MRLPDFIGIGAPKAGTTWLARCLEEHPDVYVAPVKETNFFDYTTIDGRIPEYAAHFAGAGAERVVGEISTRYLASAAAPDRVRAVLPDARLFVALRNPVEQVYSHYWHLRRQNFHQWDRARVPVTFAGALEAFPDKLLEPAFYHRHLTRWLERFPRERLHVVLHDDVRAEPRAVLRALYAYLDVDPAFVPPSIEERGDAVRRGRSPRGERLAAAQRVVYDQLNRRVYHPLKRRVGTRAAIRLKDAIGVRRALDAVFTREGYPALDPATRRSLVERFEEDVRALEGLLGRDLGAWR